METTRRPTEASAWMADSRPLPGPCTRTCTRRTPRFIASRPQFSAATVAANGVDFLDPLKPALPAVPQVTVFPFESVIVMITLLKVAMMWATPSASTIFLARLALGALVVAGVVAAAVVSGAVIYFFVTFFLPAMARRGPFLVRALVCVRWPRTGRPRRCRAPR